MCNCKNVKIGEYTNQTCIDIPPHMNDLEQWRIKNNLKPIICIDICLLEEIQHLWNLGIRTTGCCCGHNILNGYIGVCFDDIPKMKQLGYKVKYNECRPEDEDSFYPKNI